MTNPIVIQALREYGLRYNKAERRWEGLDYVICDEDLKDLSVNEIDQILAGLRDGKTRVDLGPNREFKLEADE